MKSMFKIFLKVMLGGFCAVLIFSILGAVRDVFASLFAGQGCRDFLFLPLTIAFSLVYFPSWNDWTILAFSVGAFGMLIAQLRAMFINAHSEIIAKRILLGLLLFFFLFSGIGIGIEVQKETQIKETYLEFCHAVADQNWALAYSYFSPEYRSGIGLNQFIREIINGAHSSYVESCEGEFVGTIDYRLNRAEVYPYSYTASACYLFMSDPELIFVRIKGKWYFTGEHTWYID